MFQRARSVALSFENSVTNSSESELKAEFALGTILLISSAFPPWTEVGAARWEAFTPYLLAAGWSLSVLAEEPPVGSATDFGRVTRLGSDVRVHLVPRRVPAWRESTLRLLDWCRRSRKQNGRVQSVTTTEVREPGKSSPLGSLPRELFGAAVKASQARHWIHDLVTCSETHDIATNAVMVISSGPPHDAHVAASHIAAQRGIPHVVDLRDPWIGNVADVGLAKVLFGGATGARAERMVLSLAAAIIVNTPAAAATLLSRHPAAAGRVHTVMNGSDRAPQPARVLPQGAKYVLVHTGTLYLDRDPRPFLRAVGIVRQRDRVAGERLHVVFMGHPAYIAGRRLSEWAADFGLDECFEERPFGTRDEANALMNEAAMLVAFQGATPTQVPAKIFDYVSNAAAILALTDVDSATAAVLDGTHALVAPIDDVTAIAAHIEGAFNQAIAGAAIVPVNVDGRYARANQARLLVQILQQL